MLGFNNNEMTKDQEIAHGIIHILGRINTPIYAGNELQDAVNVNQWLSSIVSGEMVLIEPKASAKPKAKPKKRAKAKAKAKAKKESSDGDKE